MTSPWFVLLLQRITWATRSTSTWWGRRRRGGRRCGITNTSTRTSLTGWTRTRRTRWVFPPLCAVCSDSFVDARFSPACGAVLWMVGGRRGGASARTHVVGAAGHGEKCRLGGDMGLGRYPHPLRCVSRCLLSHSIVAVALTLLPSPLSAVARLPGRREEAHRNHVHSRLYRRRLDTPPDAPRASTSLTI